MNWVPPSDTACKLKWTWSTIFLNTATTKSCFHNPVDRFDTKSFNFHNIPIKIADRDQMLKGQWPAGCAYCSQTEAAGGKSDRQSQNDIPDHIPNDVNLVTDPKILEVFFNNTCNLSCIYCSPSLSSAWADETRRFGPIADKPRSELIDIDKTAYSHTVDNFFTWLDQHISNIERLNVLGGEPFLLSETDRLVELLSTKQTELELNLVTNLMIPPRIFKDKVDKLENLVNNSNISKVVIMASIDGWGPEVDFQRFGLHRELWLQNFNTLLSNATIKLDINVAITCLTISSLPELIKMWNRWNQIKEVGLQGTRVFNPSFLAPEVLPSRLNRQAFEYALSLIGTDTWYKNWSRERFSNLLAIFDKQPDGNIAEMIRLRNYLNEISHRRAVDWTTIFPEISKELNQL